MATLGCYTFFLVALLLHHLIVGTEGVLRDRSSSQTQAPWRKKTRSILFVEFILAICGLQILRTPENGLLVIPLFCSLMTLVAVGEIIRTRGLQKEQECANNRIETDV